MKGQSFYSTFSKDSISKDLTKVWKEQVEPVFASHGLTCRMRERDCIMILETGDTEDEVLIERAVLALGVLTSGLTPEWVEPILLGQIYSESIVIEKPDEISEEEFSSNFDDFMNKFDNEYKLHNKWYCYVIYFEKGITVVATSSQATSAVKSLVRDSFFGTIPFQDKADMLTRDIETYNQKHGILTNNLGLFCSLLDGISDDAICENEETHRMTDIQNSRLKALKV
ncbi:PREDICTED: uncharacterized protein LOC101314078 [Fragaria vesca subsp. vesca]